MSPEKMVLMANQIAQFFGAYPPERAVPDIADHIMKFWEPRMRRQLLEHVAQGGAGLHHLVLDAAKSVRV